MNNFRRLTAHPPGGPTRTAGRAKHRQFFAAALLFLAPAACFADPITVLATLPWYVNAALSVASFVQAYGTYLALGVSVIGGQRSRALARKHQHGGQA